MPIPDADAYHFEIPFRVPDHQSVASQQVELALPGLREGDRLSLRPEEARELGEARRLTLSGYGYVAEEQAREAAARARQVLLLAAVESHVGVEWDNRGLSVWRGHRLAAVSRSGEMTAQGTTGVGADTFRTRFTRWLASRVTLTEAQEACVELLADFHFDLSARSRFLLAYAAIEELCSEPVPQTEAYRAVWGKLVECLNESEAEPGVREALRRNLDHVADVLPTNRCRRMIKAKLGKTAVKRFAQFTDARKEIAHRGKSVPDTSHDVYRLAHELLFATIERG